MKRLFNHLGQILILGSIFFLILKLPLFNIPYIQEILMTSILFLTILFVGILYYKTPKGKRKFWLILLLILLSTSPWADFCSNAENYDRQRFTAEKNNWEGDKPCNENQWKEARDILNKLKYTPSVFVPSDKLTNEQKKTYRSFRQDSHWASWVKEKFSAQGTNSAEELACASQLASLCSGYERRNRGTRTHWTKDGSKKVRGVMGKTALQIMQEDAQNYGCWPCKMAYIILTVVQSMSSKLESNMRSAGMSILQIFMLLWIVYTVFLAVVFQSKASTFIKDFMTRFLCVLVAAMILSSGDTLKSLYKDVLSPIISLGLGLSQNISNTMDESSFSFAKNVDTGMNLGVDYCQNIDNSSSQVGNNVFKNIFMNFDSYTFGSTDSLISQELQAHLLCLTQKLYRQVSPITAVGQSLVSFSKIGEKAYIGPFYLGFNFPIISMFIVGGTLTILFTIFSFLVAFKIIDIFLRLGFVLVLMPLFVAAWAFPLTRDFTKKGFMFLMGIITEFLGLVLALSFIMLIFEEGIAVNRTELIQAIRANYSSDYGKNLYDVVTSHNGFICFFMLLILFFMGEKLIGMCTKVISSFFGISALGGDITGPAAISVIKKTAQWGKRGYDVGSAAAENAEPYQVPEGKESSNNNTADKSAPVGLEVGAKVIPGDRVGVSFGDKNKDSAVYATPAASKRYYGQKLGNGLNRTSQYAASYIDKIGITTGRFFQKTGVGAIVGVPLILATKGASILVRGSGKILSGASKTIGGGIYGLVHPVKVSKAGWEKTKTGGRALWNKTTAGPKKIGAAFKRGMDKWS